MDDNIIIYSDTTISSVSTEQIKNYYNDIDTNIVSNCIKNKKINNLMKLSVKNEVNIFKKSKNNKWSIKKNKQIIKDCNKKKKSKLIELSKNIKILSLKPDNDTIKNVKKLNKHNEKKINKIDKLINLLEYSELELDSDEYIEIYSN